MKLTNKQLTDTNLNLTSLLEINARINAKKIKTAKYIKENTLQKKEKTNHKYQISKFAFVRFAKRACKTLQTSDER